MTKRRVLEDDELHIVKTLISNLNLQVKNKSLLGETFDTTKGIPQGDSLSPILFIFYLAKSLDDNIENGLQINEQIEHNYCTKENIINNVSLHLRDHSYSIHQRQGLDIKLEFADDISRLNWHKDLVDEQVNRDIEKLSKRNFIINHEKTEKHQISKHSRDEWKKCKYLGSMLGNTEDINRRKQTRYDIIH